MGNRRKGQIYLYVDVEKAERKGGAPRTRIVLKCKVRIREMSHRKLHRNESFATNVSPRYEYSKKSEWAAIYGDASAK